MLLTMKLLGYHLTLSICSDTLQPLIALNLSYKNQNHLKLKKNFQICYVQVANTLECLIDVPPPPLINFSFFFFTEDILIPTHRLLIIGESFQPRQTF